MATALIKQMQYLKENGFTEQQANTLIYFHKDSIENTLATKKDIAEVKRDIEQLRSETKTDIALLKTDLTLKLGSIMVVGVLVLAALIKL